MKSLRALLAVLAATGSAHAQGVQARWMGEISCGAWVESTDFRVAPKAVHVNFVLGILVGRSMQSGVSTLSATDIPSVVLWMDNYCRANPLSDIVEGSVKLENELLARLR